MTIKLFVVSSGICMQIGAVFYNITYGTDECTSSTDPVSSTGWGSSFFIFIEELRLDEAKQCGGKPIDCD